MAVAPLRLLVTAPPGTGKTTLCSTVYKRLCERLGNAAPACLEGFLCHERRCRGKRVAFDLAPLGGGGGDAAGPVPLATEDGPPTGHMVGKYHVHVQDLEDFTLPILDRALRATGSGPRVLIFDEIGKMELCSEEFVRLVRELLQSPDPGLHVLGTVAIGGPGFIRESKRLRQVEVLEISPASRDAKAAEVADRFAAALQPKPPGHDGEGGPSAPTDTAGDPVSFDAPPRGEHSALYLASPSANFASLNAGDYGLYVGGGAINRAFREELRACGHSPDKKYEVLHERLLADARPGRLHWVPPDGLPEGVLDNLSAFCGLVPEEPKIGRLLPVGLVSIAVFAEDCRPHGSSKNVAMVYTVGPNSGNRKRTGRECDRMGPAAFLEIVELVGKGIAAAVAQYNAEAEESLPRIEILRICLLCGGVYKHPDTSKLQVATSLIRGLLRGREGSGDAGPHLNFAWDDDVFRRAWRALQSGAADAAGSSTDAADMAVEDARPAAVLRERRVDPADGRLYTREQIEDFYRGRYSPSEIRDYWANDCRPARGR